MLHYVLIKIYNKLLTVVITKSVNSRSICMHQPCMLHIFTVITVCFYLCDPQIFKYEITKSMRQLIFLCFNHLVPVTSSILPRNSFMATCWWQESTLLQYWSNIPLPGGPSVSHLLHLLAPAAAALPLMMLCIGLRLMLRCISYPSVRRVLALWVDG